MTNVHRPPFWYTARFPLMAVLTDSLLARASAFFPHTTSSGPRWPVSGKPSAHWPLGLLWPDERDPVASRCWRPAVRGAVSGQACPEAVSFPAVKVLEMTILSPSRPGYSWHGRVVILRGVKLWCSHGRWHAMILRVRVWSLPLRGAPGRRRGGVNDQGPLQQAEAGEWSKGHKGTRTGAVQSIHLVLYKCFTRAINGSRSNCDMMSSLIGG